MIKNPKSNRCQNKNNNPYRNFTERFFMPINHFATRFIVPIMYCIGFIGGFIAGGIMLGPW